MKQFIRQGRKVAVDLDLAKFFDRVNHDVLMSRVARRINDKRVLCSLSEIPQGWSYDQRSSAGNTTATGGGRVGHSRQVVELLRSASPRQLLDLKKMDNNDR